MNKLSLPALAAPATPDWIAPAEEYVTWRQVASLVRRRWAIVAAVTLLCVGAAVLYASRAARVYEASALILIDKDEYNLPETVSHHATDEGDLSTEIEVLRSAQLSESVAHDLALNVTVAGTNLPRSHVVLLGPVADSALTERIELQRDTAGRFTAASQATGQQLRGIVPGQMVTVGLLQFTLLPAAASLKHFALVRGTEAAAAAGLQHDLRVGRGDRNANVIWVRYRSNDPQLASAVPTALTRRYLSDRVASAKAKVQTAIAFLTEQADTLRTQLTAADEALHDFRQSAGVVSLTDQAADAVRQSGDLRASRDQLEAQRSALQQLISRSDTSARTFRQLAAFPTLIGNPTVANLLHTADDIDGQRTDLLQRRTPKDPDVLALTHHLADVDDQLRAITLTYLAGLTQQVRALDQALGAQAQVAATLPEKTMREDELSRRPKVLSDVYSLVETRLQEARIAESAANPGVSIVDRPTTPTIPVWPRGGLVLAVGCTIGLLGGFGLAWLRDGMDRAIHSRADVARAVEVPVLGAIPHIQPSSAWHGQADSVLIPGAPLAGRIGPGGSRARPSVSAAELTSLGSVLEAYTWLETSLTFSERAVEPRTLTVTSALAGEGKTVTASNMAIATARDGRRVLVIDADLRRGQLHKPFGISSGPGLSDVLAGTTPLQDAIVAVPVGGDVIVHVLPRGAPPAHPAALLKSPGLAGLMATVGPRYDLVILDSPPVNLVSDALLLGKLVDGVIVVARAGITDADALTQAVRHLRDANAPLLGVLLNDINLHRESRYDESYQYLHQAGSYAAATES